MNPSRHEIGIVGGGLAGASAALAFAQAGFDTVHIAAPHRHDGRSTALIGPSVRFLERLGIVQALEERAQPMFAMRLVDDTGRLLRAAPVEFRAAEIGLPYFGLNVLNRELLETLTQESGKVADRLTHVEEPVVSVDLEPERATVRTESGRTISCRLLVGSDGRHSVVRTAMQAPVRTWSYPQVALVLNFGHQRDHEGISTEFHTATGPFTQVPLPGRRSSLVWVETPDEALRLKDLRVEDISREVERRLHSILGAVEVEEPIQSFPLSGASVSRLSGLRSALVGEAAHVFPPIGAQGLNLGIRDVEALLDVALDHRDDPGGTAMLAAYEARRRADVATRTAAVDLLNRSLLTGFLPVQAARAIGLGALASVPALRHALMREGVQPGSALAGIAARVRSLLPGQRASG
ncbi:UbiH/UbiF family hydroxylase [Aureimonas phyllosphaerae]|uniref:2-octaprenyl-6-methoxyphenol hydroxylase n=1 Tax=Aureimonas phyllosphaerae TaxID=1166078 RepID=A0A7W6BRC3_9HYPH|nr:UbiH/UbiF family hydroxylase [Aureimonas phyllosphaerae]MBB3934880.1 2-octaprenyl-6-methoxyphenol hydroxylase [Aureimonas phyllosphaerae]SFF44368.1 2-octaprenyl-3-methyl-6-methoxy-1,4-benzoquinol hydroxylase [Aureimonas phyllosphaerae]